MIENTEKRRDISFLRSGSKRRRFKPQRRIAQLQAPRRGAGRPSGAGPGPADGGMMQTADSC